MTAGGAELDGEASARAASRALRPSQLPLRDIHVLNLADARADFCGRVLADLGADVRRGDSPDQPADVLLLSGTPSELARRTLDPVVLLERQPRLIVAVLSSFGLRGPRAEWHSCDTVAQALGGMLSVNGHVHEPPLRGLGPQAHHVAGVHAAIGVVLALRARGSSGRGQLVDVSVQESTVAALEHVMGVFRERGVVAARQGTLHWSGAFRVAQCRDGPVLLSHLGDWTALVEWLKADGAAQDLAEPRWMDAAVRRAECVHVFDVLAAWAAQYAVDDLVEQAQLRRLPFAPVWPLATVTQHPQLWARGFFTRGPTHAVIRRGGPFRFSAPFEDAAPSAPYARRAAYPLAAPTERRPSGPALRGIRVLDFTWVVAGPVATRVLADHGADVIKVERLDAPDGAQRRGGLFGNLNRGKRSLAVDLADPRGIGLVRDLARRCDVVIDNFSPRVMANWGLDHAALRALDARLIAVSLSGFGASGPFANHVSYGPTLQAQSGFTWHMRHPHGAPAGWGFSYSDMVSGYCAALAVLAALWERDAGGVGRAVDLAQLEVLAAMIGPSLDAALAGCEVPDAFGNRSPDRVAAPDGVYRCRDGAMGRERWCALAVCDDGEWRRFVIALGAPAWAREPRFATTAGRREHGVALDQLLEAWTRARSAESVMETLQAAGLAAGVVADARDLVADPQLAARGYWVTLPDGTELDGVVPRLSATPGAIAAGGPRLGEHTDEVLHDLLAMEQSAIDRLRKDGVVR
jgi:crotonobetainyl-CoA:carnitine CoA-transferase CaiB-like acyl-CoA transferase